FRLRALSNVDGEATWAAIAELTPHCEGVKFVGEPWALASGDLRLPKVIGSHMVLQRDVPPVIWGWAEKGEGVTVALDGNNRAETKADDKGAWKVTLKAVKADGKAHKLVVTGKAGEGSKIELEDILIGDVWIGSGQSNMELPVGSAETAGQAIKEANHPKIRLFHVPKVQNGAPAGDVNATWRVCSPQTIPAFSAVLYYFGRRLHKDLDVPMGLINSSWGGSAIEPWTIAGGKSGGMYNGMIAPLVPFAIRGAIWYQGEANAIYGNGFAYFDKTKALIEGWREAWGTDFPFYFVQIAPCSGWYGPGQLPALWEAQVASLKIPKTGMAVTTDIVHDIGDVHPRNKRDVGKRLALWALAKTYGKKDLVYSGPLYESMKVEGNKVRLFFAHTGGGLKSRDGKPLSEFQIAGADDKFVPATATIDGKTVVVESDKVASPTQARFGWHKTANPNLVNKEGLPASPFRTNGWRGGTGE
ncbi:MAG: sialate O-acetylesterase, partial [Planctomycetota bacterium]